MVNPSELIVDSSAQTAIEVDSANHESYPQQNLDTSFYSERPGADQRELDVLEQLNANLNHLEDIYGRFRFVLSEIKHVIARRTE